MRKQTSVQKEGASPKCEGAECTWGTARGPTQWNRVSGVGWWEIRVERFQGQGPGHLVGHSKAL